MSISRAKTSDGYQIERYAFLDAKDICRELKTSIRNGLSTEQVQANRSAYGRNRLDKRTEDTFWHRLRRSFINPFNIILFSLGLISLVTDMWIFPRHDGPHATVVIVFSMIVISGLIRLVQELRAKNAADQLERLVSGNVKVKRDGRIVELPVEELVVGDRVYVTAGERIPADIRLTATRDLFLSQAAITGESTPVRKSYETANTIREIPPTHLENLALMASMVVGGSGEGIVLAAGANTFYGRFSRSPGKERNVFQKGASSIGGVLFRFMAVLVPIVFVLLGLTRGKWLASFAFALSISVGLIPEMLPMVITACLVKGSLAMGRKKTIIKDIDAMEVFGQMDVLCMDKTGTLTQESMQLEYFLDILGNESTEVLDLAYLNSFFQNSVPNSIEKAILSCQSMPGHEKHFKLLTEEYTPETILPFDHDRKITSVVVKNAEGHSKLLAKGDISQIIARCNRVEYKGQTRMMGAAFLKDVSAIVDEMTRDGMKVIAIASKELTSPNGPLAPEDEKKMILNGYLIFFNAPKDTAKASVAAMRRLGVTPKILTGDLAAVAASVCHRVSIPVDEILTGSQIDGLEIEELSRAVESNDVFAELTPAQKVRIVSALRRNGHTVGFLGDGLNDVPAFREADVAISVDTAVDAARETADVILQQKDLLVLEQGILEGRKTFVNMLKYVKITASSNYGNILSIVCASAFLPFLPMTSVQILLLNLLYDSLCVFLPWDNVDAEETLSSREWSGKTLGRFMRRFGPISSIFDILTFLFLYFQLCPALCGGGTYLQLTDLSMQTRYVSLFQTGWFLESMWTQVLILHFLRTARIPFLESRPSFSFVCVTFLGVAVFTAIPFSGAAPLLGLTPLPPIYFGFLITVVFAYMLLTTAAKYFYQNKFRELI